MSLYQPSALLAHLDALKTGPKKRLSQNFLVDGNILRKILKTADVKKDDLIVEVGPGPGALTQALLAAGCRVLAVEKDPSFASALPTSERLEVFEDDILEFPLEKILKERLKNGEKAKIVANLPYQITTPILTQFLPLSSLLASVTVMVQKEVGERLVAKKNSAAYSSLTLFAKFYSDPHYAFTVEPTCFFPRPKVQSAVLHFSLQSAPLSPHLHEKFFHLTRSSFQKRRKMLRSSLKDLFSSERIEQALKGIGLKETSRPEDLALTDFLALFYRLHQPIDRVAEKRENT